MIDDRGAAVATAPVRVNEELLAAHSRIESDGVREQALHFPSGDGWCLGILYVPPEPQELGFVTCHSYGLELLTLRRVEREVARTLAALGHPVLSFHHRGYGDSSGSLADATLASHLEDVESAVGVLRRETGTSRLGLIGGRFGALMAGLRAKRGGVERLILMNPAWDGATYFRQLMREMRLVLLSSTPEDERRSVDQDLAMLAAQGSVDVLGYDIHRTLYEETSREDLSRNIGDFRGDALMLNVAKRPTTPKRMEAFTRLVAANGGTSRTVFVKEPAGTTFGGPAFVSTGVENTRVNVQQPMLEEIAMVVKEWMKS